MLVWHAKAFQNAQYGKSGQIFFPEWGSVKTPDRDKPAPDGFDEGAGSAGLFDPTEPDEDDLWFLPGPDDDADPVQGQGRGRLRS